MSVRSLFSPTHHFPKRSSRLSGRRTSRARGRHSHASLCYLGAPPSQGAWRFLCRLCDILARRPEKRALRGNNRFPAAPPRRRRTRTSRRRRRSLRRRPVFAAQGPLPPNASRFPRLRARLKTPTRARPRSTAATPRSSSTRTTATRATAGRATSATCAAFSARAARPVDLGRAPRGRGSSSTTRAGAAFSQHKVPLELARIARPRAPDAVRLQRARHAQQHARVLALVRARAVLRAAVLMQPAHFRALALLLPVQVRVREEHRAQHRARGAHGREVGLLRGDRLLQRVEARLARRDVAVLHSEAQVRRPKTRGAVLVCLPPTQTHVVLTIFFLSSFFSFFLLLFPPLLGAKYKFI